MIFESHAHYDDDAFTQDREVLLKEIYDHGIHYILNAGSSIESCRKIIEYIKQYSFMYGALGIHPCDTGELTEADFQWLKEQCVLDKIKAIGEIGLDYYWDTPAREVQKKWFIKQLYLAKEMALPVVIHSRDAAKDTLDIMKENHAEDTGGVIHCFSYGIEMVKEYLDMGFYIGIGGVLTFQNAKKLKEVAEYVPIDRILLETDSPYLSPVPFRGKRNDSLKLVYVAEALSAIKGVSQEEIENMTCQNARTLFSV